MESGVGISMGLKIVEKLGFCSRGTINRTAGSDLPEDPERNITDELDPD